MSNKLSHTNSILAVEADQICWVTCRGKGSFLNSSLMKKWVYEQLETHPSHLVLDLEDCVSMDSTFMGTIAGIALKLRKVPQTEFEIIDCSEHNLKSLEDLGLGSVLSINKENAPWEGKVEYWRNSLKELSNKDFKGEAQYVLEAHKLLCDVDKVNEKRFEDVLQYLKGEQNGQS